MTSDTTTPSGRPAVAAVALGFAGAASACLLWRELSLFRGVPLAALGLALATLPALAAAGAALARRMAARRDPASLLGPFFAALAVALPASLLASRAAGALFHPTAVAAPSLPAMAGMALAAFLLPGVCLGFGLQTLRDATAGPRHGWSGSQTRLAGILALAASAGALFDALVALPKLGPVNASLDLALGVCAAGIVCAAGVTDDRRAETWLSLLALGLVLTLPISGPIDARTGQWGRVLDAKADKAAVAPAPGDAARGRMGPVAAGLAAILGAGAAIPWQRKGKAPRPEALAAMAEAAAILVLALGGLARGVVPPEGQSWLAAAFFAGEASGLFLGRRPPWPRAAMTGPALALAAAAAVVWPAVPPPLPAWLAMSLAAGAMGGLFRATSSAAPDPLATAAGFAVLAVFLA